MRGVHLAPGLKSGLLVMAITLYPVLLALPRSIAQPAVQQDRAADADRLFKKGKELFKKQEFRSAITYFEQALPIYQKLRDRSNEGGVLFSLGKAYNALYRHEKAVYYYEQALPIYRKSQAGISEILFDLGSSYGALSQYKKAISYYEELLAAHRKYPANHRLTNQASVLIKLGEMYSALSQNEKASIYYEQARNLFKVVPGGGDDNSGKISSEVGLFFQQQNQLELAIIFYKKSVNYYESFRRNLFTTGLTRNQSQDVLESHTRSVSSTYRTLADLLLQQNRTVEALKVLDLLKVKDLQDFVASPKRNQFTAAESIELLRAETDIAIGFIGLIENRFGKLDLGDYAIDAQGTTASGEKLNSQQVATRKAEHESLKNALTAFLQHPVIEPLVKNLKDTAANQNISLPYYQDLQTRFKKLGKNMALLHKWKLGQKSPFLSLD
jgi:tetratricopeptide (TPR) repeat protein